MTTTWSTSKPDTRPGMHAAWRNEASRQRDDGRAEDVAPPPPEERRHSECRQKPMQRTPSTDEAGLAPCALSDGGGFAAPHPVCCRRRATFYLGKQVPRGHRERNVHQISEEIGDGASEGGGGTTVKGEENGSVGWPGPFRLMWCRASGSPASKSDVDGCRFASARGDVECKHSMAFGVAWDLACLV
ncbi:hypothetical protein LZ30DRAFT_333230 [Colletotrichum cereale]|nr:hypothetical protein LZ30DRAFT_333230 [Colletotrichum cereale]